MHQIDQWQDAYTIFIVDVKIIPIIPLGFILRLLEDETHANAEFEQK